MQSILTSVLCLSAFLIHAVLGDRAIGEQAQPEGVILEDICRSIYNMADSMHYANLAEYSSKTGHRFFLTPMSRLLRIEHRESSY